MSYLRHGGLGQIPGRQRLSTLGEGVLMVVRGIPCPSLGPSPK